MFLTIVTGRKLSFLVVKSSISLEEMKLAVAEHGKKVMITTILIAMANWTKKLLKKLTNRKKIEKLTKTSRLIIYKHAYEFFNA